MRRMRPGTTDRALVLALTMAGGWAGHHGGDYLWQTDRDACDKQLHNRDWLDHVHVGEDDKRTPAELDHDGKRALASHCIEYAVTQGLTKAVLYRAAGLRVPLSAQVAGAIVAAVLHGGVDDGRPLQSYAGRFNKVVFYKKADHGINGRALLDQAAHKSLGIPATAMFTTMLAAAIVKRRARRLASAR